MIFCIFLSIREHFFLELARSKKCVKNGYLWIPEIYCIFTFGGLALFEFPDCALHRGRSRPGFPFPFKGQTKPVRVAWPGTAATVTTMRRVTPSPNSDQDFAPFLWSRHFSLERSGAKAWARRYHPDGLASPRCDVLLLSGLVACRCLTLVCRHVCVS